MERIAIKEKEVEIPELTIDVIDSMIYVVRGVKVMLDFELSKIYGYETRYFNRQVNNNIEKFESDFMFQLTKEEFSEILMCKNFTSSWGGTRKLPYAFTEQGIYMLATVLRGELAEQQRIFIMRAFREMRHYIKRNQQFVAQEEVNLVTARVSEISVKMASMSDRQKKTEQNVQNIQKRIEVLSENFVSEKDYKNFVIYKGQKFEADAAYIDIYQQAVSSIYVVDDYVNTKTLQLLSQKKQGVEVVLFTENGHGLKGFLTAVVVSDFANQYPPFCVKSNPDCHDRLIVIDYGLPTEQAYHCGASSKDAGKKLCAINKIENTAMIHPVIDELLTGEDKVI